MAGGIPKDLFVNRGYKCGLLEICEVIQHSASIYDTKSTGDYPGSLVSGYLKDLKIGFELRFTKNMRRDWTFRLETRHDKH